MAPISKDGAARALMLSGRFGFLDHAPELKSLGIDCLLDRSAREVVRRSVIGTDRAGGGPGTMALRELAAREVAREGPQTSPRFRLENVNSHDLTLRETNVSPPARPWKSDRIFAVRETGGRDAEADGRGQRQAE